MVFVTAQPESLTAAASRLAGIGSTLGPTSSITIGVQRAPPGHRGCSSSILGGHPAITCESPDQLGINSPREPGKRRRVSYANTHIRCRALSTAAGSISSRASSPAR
jgi:hypothetical protein